MANIPEQDCKPNSVEGDHSSRREVAFPLQRPTRIVLLAKTSEHK